VQRGGWMEFRMATFGWQTWNSGPFSAQRGAGSAPGTIVVRFCGPFTERDIYTHLQPLELNNILEIVPRQGEPPISKHILDMTACTSMDSRGLGLIATHLARCQKRGVKLVVAGASPRVRQVFQITRMDSVIPLVSTVAEAEAL
jgi:anti-anti-sigma factor